MAKQAVQTNPNALERLDKIDLLSARAAETVRQLLTFARKDRLSKNTFNLNVHIEEACELSRTMVPENINRKISLCDAPLYIHGDAGQLHQVLFNLLNNAVDAVANTPNPQIVCALARFTSNAHFAEKYPELNSKDFARITIKDNGEGIAKDTLEKIFEPFFTTKEVNQGTGLGLSMVYGSIQAHAGMIEVESEPEQGTSFHIYLPLTEQQEEITSKSNPTQPKNCAEHTCILLVDDEEELRETTAEVLINMGYHVLQAADGEQALTIYKAQGQHISLIMTDIIMPNMGGELLLKAIREFDPHVPFILVTGYNKDHILKESMINEQHYLILNKPIHLASIKETIQALIYGA